MATTKTRLTPERLREQASAEVRPKIEALEAKIEALQERGSEIKRRLAVLPRLEEAARAKAVAAGESSWATVRPIADERRALEEELACIAADVEGLTLDLRVVRDKADKQEAEAVLARANAIARRQRARLERAAEEFSAVCAELLGELAADEAELNVCRSELRGMGRERWVPESGVMVHDSVRALALTVVGVAK